MEIVDLSFRVIGEALPLDHGYWLYAAVSRLVQNLHESKDVGIHPLRGDATGDGHLRVVQRTKLRIRTPTGRIRDFLPLCGATLDLDAHKLRIGTPSVLVLKPAANLAARMVTIKGFMEPADFIEAARRQLDHLGISQQAALVIPTACNGQPDAAKPIRRVLRIKDKTIVGFALQVSGLSAEESLNLQQRGLGGRRRMGCGIFVPLRG